MEHDDATALDTLLADLPVEDAHLTTPAAEPARAARDLPKLMRRIPVTLTLEVGQARVSLAELVALGADSVVELDTLAGTPLTLKANGCTIGRAEVVVAGENYGLKVIEIAGLDLDSLAG
nr:FliM/FliN family flagellar motor switch protein [Pelomonas sp. KK5]